MSCRIGWMRTVIYPDMVDIQHRLNIYLRISKCIVFLYTFAWDIPFDVILSWKCNFWFILQRNYLWFLSPSINQYMIMYFDISHPTDDDSKMNILENEIFIFETVSFESCHAHKFSYILLVHCFSIILTANAIQTNESYTNVENRYLVLISACALPQHTLCQYLNF